MQGPLLGGSPGPLFQMSSIFWSAIEATFTLGREYSGSVDVVLFVLWEAAFGSKGVVCLAKSVGELRDFNHHD